MSTWKTIWEAMRPNLTDDQWKWISRNATAENRLYLLVSTSIAMISIVGMYLFSLHVPSLYGKRFIYWVFFLLVVLLNIVARRTEKDNEKLMQFLMYAALAILLAYTAILGTVLSSNEAAISFDVVILVLPMAFIDKPGRMTAVIIVGTVFFTCMAFLFDSPAVFWSDFANAIIYSLIAIFVNRLMLKVRIEKIFYEMELMKLGERDILTGLHNRNSYEKKLGQYAEKCDTMLTCIYLDANGLHELNNGQGHAAGDEMLKYVGAALRDAFGDRDTYRIGGDEFVAFGRDVSKEEAEEKVERMVHLVEGRAYHVSIGIAEARKPHIVIDSLIRKAEVEMYKDKSRYYEAKGRDWKRNRESFTLETKDLPS